MRMPFHTGRHNRDYALHDNTRQTNAVNILDRLSAPLELAHVDVQHLLVTEHAPQTERHTEYLADNGRERRTADAHLRERTDTERSSADQG